MSFEEPENFQELHLWLDAVATRPRFHEPLPNEFEGRFDKPDDVRALLIAFEAQYAQAMRSVVEVIWRDREEAVRDLPPHAVSLLRLRIEQARELIAELITMPDAESPMVSLFGYPAEHFRELVRWLLSDWWEQHGQRRAADRLYLQYSSFRPPAVGRN
jgi:hypothetical protein